VFDLAGNQRRMFAKSMIGKGLSLPVRDSWAGRVAPTNLLYCWAMAFFKPGPIS